jgi:sigma-B regulation protein RsbQ
MSVLKRNNVVVSGNGEQAIMFAHGFGCDQHMWRFVAPSFEENYKTILFDYVGAGQSDLSAFEPSRYASLEGYADDIVQIGRELGLKDAILVGHSVSAMIGALVTQKAPGMFKALIMVGPSPSYINDNNYVGGFTAAQIDELLKSLERNHLGWSVSMAPVIMGNPDRPELGEELANSFCRTDPDMAKQFARTTFLTDSRHILSDIEVPTLILQCSDDIIAPYEVGNYLHKNIKDSKLVVMKATGHCPNLSAPQETVSEITAYLHAQR